MFPLIGKATAAPPAHRCDLRRVASFILLFVAQVDWSRADEVGLWKRYEVAIDGVAYDANPFDVDIEAVFTSPTGRSFTQIGFYAGGDVWKIYFMPDEVGVWSYQLRGGDVKSRELSGGFTCVDSDLLAPVVAHGNRWRIQNGRGDFPVIWNPPVDDRTHWGFRSHKSSDPAVEAALRFADEVVGARFLALGELVVFPIDWAKDWPQDAVPYVQGREGEEFHLPFWDQLNAKLDAARDRNIGLYVMFYSDDALTPDRFGVTPYSPQELRLFRYAVARLACYPHVLWD
ncbi:MAG: DUF5060 domain-containing protein, partial [Planctomycetales bacterium]|nr:DUF5060 domain-containing protein [Planctomycetales bacterium]